MKEVSTPGEVYAVMARIKSGAKEYLTNLYPNDEKLDYWTRKKVLFIDDCRETAFFFWKDRDFFHLYYCSQNRDSLRERLIGLYSSYSDVIVVDIIGKDNDLLLPVSLFEDAGFRKYVKYVRIAKSVGQDEELPPVSADVILPEPGDAEVITKMFEASFDLYAEQVPCSDEIGMAIRDKKITVIKDDGKIVGILMRDITEFTATGRFFLVDSNIRGKGIGSKLMNYFLTECKGKRINGWVLAVNTNSLQIYGHYNFKIDSLKDQLMINKKELVYERKN